MKVVHVGYEHNHNDARILKKECTFLSREGYDVTYVTSNKNGVTDKDQEAGVKLVTVPIKNIKKVRWYIYLRDLYKVLMELDADVYHIHEFVLFPLIKKLKKKGKVVIYDMHEMAIRQIEKDIRNRFGKVLGGALISKLYKEERKGIQLADYNITVTPSALEYMRQYTDKAYMITNYPILPERYTPPDYTGKSLCFTGLVSQSWNHEEILEAMEDVPEVTYELAGLTTDDYLAKLKAKPSWTRVHYHGMLPFEEVAPLQRGAMVGMALVLSDQVGKEGTLGNTKLFEYMGVGIPFICTNYTLWEEIAKTYDCGICVDPRKPAEIKAAIEYFLNYPDRVREMGQNGRRAVVAKYNWQQQSLILKEIYDEIREKQYDKEETAL